MITNQIMKRPLADFTVEQRTKDAFFNASDLLKQWNSDKNLNTQKNGDFKRKDIDDYFNNKATKQFIKALCEEEGFTKAHPAWISTRGKNGGTWMSPLLFIDFAMWLNPVFKVKVLRFVYDQMLTYRNEAGDAYKALSSAMNKICTPHQMKKYMPILGKGINFIVTGRHEHKLRNEYGTEEKQKEYFELEKQVAMLIDEGFLKTPDDVANYLRRKFQKKYF